MHLKRIFLSLLLLSGAAAWSQAHPPTQSESRRWEIYGGPVFTGSNPSGATFGGGFGIDGNMFRWVGAGGEFTLVRTTCCVVNNITVTDYLVGPRIARPLSRSARISPFGDVLFGGQTLNNSSNHHSWFYGSGTGPAVAADGGLGLRLTNRLGFHGQLGYLYSRFATSGGSAPLYNSRWRAATYLAYRF